MIDCSRIEKRGRIIQYNGGLNLVWAYNFKISAVEFCLKMRFFALFAEYLTDEFVVAMKNRMLNFTPL